MHWRRDHIHYVAESYVFSKLVFTFADWENSLGIDSMTQLSIKLYVFNGVILIRIWDSFIY